MKKLLVACVAVFALDARLRAQSPVSGPEFLVNVTTTGDQGAPAVANVGESCDFIVVWSDSGGIVGRLFDATGTPPGGEFPISASGIGIKSQASIGANAAGNFIVTWSEDDPGGVSLSGVRARRFDATGASQGGDIVVDQDTTFTQRQSAVAVDSEGEFVVVWQSGTYIYGSYGTGPGQDGMGYGIFGRRFDSSGNALGDEFQINQYTPGDQVSPSIAMNPGGDFIVVWSSWQQGNVMARRYDAGGAPLDGEFRVNEEGHYLGGYAGGYADVALDTAGKAIVVWDSLIILGPELELDVRGQRLDASGNKLGPEFKVNAYTPYHQMRPKVASSGPDGSFIVVWSGHGEIGDGANVIAQRYSSSGRPIDGEFLVNSVTTGAQRYPVIAAQPNGQLVAAWHTPGSVSDVKARVAGFPSADRMRLDDPHIEGPGQRPGSSNLNGVLESGEQVVVEPAFANNSPGDPITLSGTASNFQGPAGPVYSIVDGSADYGTIDAGADVDCFQATEDCFQVSVAGVRPVPHWDATFDETVSYNGFSRTAELHIGESFPDVPTGHPFYAFIENLFHNGVTEGCGAGGYCPADAVTRAQMAVFLLKARWGAAFLPIHATGDVFMDVPAPNPFARWIEELAREGITGGCGPNLYCPNDTVTRQQMAVFLLKTLEGSAYLPPACVGIFDDVPCTPAVGFSDWIEELSERGITGGCSVTPPLYCPTNPNDRGQMAVFLVKTFGLVLYGG